MLNNIDSNSSVVSHFSSCKINLKALTTFSYCFRIKSSEVGKAREARLSGTYYLQGLVLAYSNGTVARIPLTA